MHPETKELQKKIQEELDAYTADNSQFKSYFLSMKEISLWLQEGAK